MTTYHVHNLTLYCDNRDAVKVPNQWAAFQAAKDQYDPDHVLTPGQNIF